MTRLFGGEEKPFSTLGSSQIRQPKTTPASGTTLLPQASSGASNRELENDRDRPAGGDGSAGTLVVGPQIVLSGEVKSCNRLVVEGTIKANIKECRDIAIAEGGLFRGSAAVQSAEISGCFEGELKVSGRLLIRTPGLVSGTVQYREIEIERGGRITGNVSAEKPSATS